VQPESYFVGQFWGWVQPEFYFLWVSSGEAGDFMKWEPPVIPICISSLQLAKNQCCLKEPPNTGNNWRASRVFRLGLIEINAQSLLSHPLERVIHKISCDNNLELWILLWKAPKQQANFCWGLDVKTSLNPSNQAPNPSFPPCLPKWEGTPFHSMRLHCPFHEEIAWPNLEGPWW
jgi:hypothetical protein